MPKISYTPQTPRSLREIARRLEVSAEKARDLAKQMDESNWKVVEMPNYKSLIQGMEWIESFGHEAQATILRVREEEYTYEATPEELANEKKVAKRGDKRKKL